MTCADMLFAIFDLIARFATALFGAGAGATAAYLYARHKQTDEDRRKMHGHAIAAFYTMLARYSALENFTRKYLNNARDSFEDEYALSLTYQHLPREPLSIQSLAFMGDPKDSDLLYALTVSEARYFDFADAYETRHFDLKAAFSVLQAEGYSPGELVPKALLDRPQVKFVFIQNGNSIRSLHSALKSVREEIDRLHNSIKIRFKGLPAPYIATREIEEANKTARSNR